MIQHLCSTCDYGCIAKCRAMYKDIKWAIDENPDIDSLDEDKVIGCNMYKKKEE